MQSSFISWFKISLPLSVKMQFSSNIKCARWEDKLPPSNTEGILVPSVTYLTFIYLNVWIKFYFFSTVWPRSTGVLHTQKWGTLVLTGVGGCSSCHCLCSFPLLCLLFTHILWLTCCLWQCMLYLGNDCILTVNCDNVLSIWPTCYLVDW